MLLVLKKTLLGHRLALLLMGLGLAALEVLLPTTYTALGSDRGDLLSQMPRGFQALLKTGGDLTPLLGAEGYLAVGYRHPIYLVVIAAFAIASTSSLAREVERGTVFLLLARPFPRYQLVLAQGSELLLGLLVLLVAALGGMAFGVAITDMEESIRLGRFVLVSLNALLLYLAIGGYALLFSSISSEGSRAIALSTGLTVAFFFVDFASELWEPLEFLGPWSLFHYYNPAAIVQSGTVAWEHALALSGVALACFTAAVLAFQQRDIP
ncbi:MAG: ABC transporter permease subunit [Chloroflexi bacterium]|nr:ABC transporter permease subunit [Chloroflexota bacterium]